MTDAWADRLSDYLDRELDPKEQDRIADHLEQCEECRAILEDFRRIRDWGASFQTGSADDPGWRSLERRIRRVAGIRRGLRAAAVVVAVVGLGAVLLDHSHRSSRERRVEQAPRATGGESVATDGDESVTAEVGALGTLLPGRADQLDPRTRGVLEDGLATLDRTLARLRRERRENPRNSLLQELEHRSEEQRVSLLRRAEALSRSGEEGP